MTLNAKMEHESLRRKHKGCLTGRDAILFAIAEGQHVLLDLARRAYQELLAHIMGIFSKLLKLQLFDT